VEVRYKHKDGGYRWIEVAGVSLLDDPAVRGVVLSSHDITERRRAESELRMSEERFRELAELLPEIVYEMDERGIITFANRQAFEITGYTPADLKSGFEGVELFVPAERERVKENIGRIMRGESTGANEYTARRKDGSTFPVLVRSEPIYREGRKAGLRGIIMDITERKSIEDALRESESRYRALFNSRTQLIYLHDAQGRFIDANDRALELLGYGREEIGRVTFGDIMAPEDVPRARENARKIAEGTDTGVDEYRLRSRSGRELWVAATGSLLKREGRPDAIIGVARDVTGAKRAETAMAESETLFKAIFDSAAHGLVLADIEGRRFHSANRRFCEMTGYDRAELLDLTVADIHPEEALPDVIESFERQAAGEVTLAPGVPVKRKDGSVFYADVSAKSLRLKGRDYLMGIFVDVTEQRRAQEALRESEELYRTLVDALPDAITMSDLDGRITFASRQTAELHGFSDPDEMVGVDSLDLITPEDRSRALAGLKKTRSEGSVKGVEFTFLRRDGSRFPAELSAATVGDGLGSGAKAFVAITRDVTERKRTEEALRKVEDRRADLALEVATLRSELTRRYGPDSIIGQDPKMREVYDTILAVSRTNATVLVQGETGTGKELVAKAVHYNSSRSEKPFIKVDCGALAENLLESELFGHVKGAFTGAVTERAGRFELAADGTIFLDEIHNLSLPLQAKLLRVVQEGRFEKVGGTKTVGVDVRIVAATNETLADLVAAGRFRKDLFYRINVIPIVLPPLRERRGDIPLLVRSFIERFGERHGKKISGVSREALDCLVEYDWPGNVRELENIVEQAVVFARGPTIQPEDVRLPESSGEARPSLGDGKSCLKKALRDPEKRLLLEALSRTGGNKKRAAELLGISRSALYEKLRRHGVSTKK
jgi:PAS domain S-box-containing protein